MKPQPWVSSCRAVQDRRVAQANAQHVARLMNVRPSIDMRRPKALSYKRSNAKREHMEVSRKPFHVKTCTTKLFNLPTQTIPQTLILVWRPFIPPPWWIAYPCSFGVGMDKKNVNASHHTLSLLRCFSNVFRFKKKNKKNWLVFLFHSFFLSSLCSPSPSFLNHQLNYQLHRKSASKKSSVITTACFVIFLKLILLVAQNEKSVSRVQRPHKMQPAHSISLIVKSNFKELQKRTKSCSVVLSTAHLRLIAISSSSVRQITSVFFAVWQKILEIDNVQSAREDLIQIVLLWKKWELVARKNRGDLSQQGGDVVVGGRRWTQLLAIVGRRQRWECEKKEGGTVMRFNEFQ